MTYLPLLAQMASAETLSALTKISLIHDLAIVMLVAGIVAAVFHWLGWPKVIGYIAAGAFMHLPIFKGGLITDKASIDVLANLGIIFLMFSLGLNLNIRKLRKLGGTAFPVAIWDLLMMIILGFACGRYCFGWDVIPSIFLGAVICDSSTTLLAKSLDEMGCSKEKFASIIFGSTISEDILTIGVMAVLTGLALTGKFQADILLQKLLYLALFLIGVLAFGLFLLPKMLNKMLNRLKDDETLLVIVLGICFGISLIAEQNNYSLALGAFLVGAVVSESKVRQKILDQTSGIYILFSAVFFVTIGLMVDLPQMWHNGWRILGVMMLVLAGKTLNCLFVSMLTGQTFRESLQIGVGLAQIGDFAYLVAMLGSDLRNGESPFPEMYQIAVGVSILTTLINPFLLKKAGPAADKLIELLPQGIQTTLDNYRHWASQTGKNLTHHKEFDQFIHRVILFIICLALLPVIFIVGSYSQSFSEENILIFGSIWIHGMWQWICLVLCIFGSIPLLWSGIWLSNSIARLFSTAATFNIAETRQRKVVRSFIRYSCAILLLGTQMIVFILSFAEFIYEADTKMLASKTIFENQQVLFSIVLSMAIILSITYILGKKKLKDFYHECDDVFKSLLSEEEQQGERQGNPTESHEFMFWIPDSSASIGIPFNRLRLRNKTGATVSVIYRRSGEILTNPPPTAAFQEGDRVTFLGDHDVELKTTEYLCKASLEDVEDSVEELPLSHVGKLTVPADSSVCGKSLKDLRLRNLTGATVARIIREGMPIMRLPGPDDILQPGDVIAVLGTDEQITALRKLITSTQE